MNLKPKSWIDEQMELGMSCKLANRLNSAWIGDSKEDIKAVYESGILFSLRGYGLSNHNELASRLGITIPKLTKGSFITMKKRRNESNRIIIRVVNEWRKR